MSGIKIFMNHDDEDITCVFEISQRCDEEVLAEVLN